MQIVANNTQFYIKFSFFTFRMFALLKNIFSLSSNPLFATYNSNIRHRFHNHIIAGLLLLIYEVLMLFFSTAQVRGLQNGDLWFQILAFLPLRSLLVSIGLLIWYVMYIYKDYKGVRDEKEQAAYEVAELAAIAQGKGKGTIPPKTQWRINWLHTLRMFCEAFIYAAVLFAALPYITDAILHIIAPSTPPPIPPTKQLLNYETTVIQGFAIACGGAVYEELIFRYHLIRYLNGKLGKYIKPISSPFLLKALDKTKWVHAPRFAASLFSSAIIYSLSHILIPTGDSFHLYFFFYRIFFACAMTWIMTQRKFGITVMTHALYDIFYFAAL